MARFEGTVRLATAADAERIAASVRAGYGATYLPPFAHAAFVAREIALGDASYALALSGDHAVGHAALVRRGPGGLFELERATVHAGHRDRGAFGALGELLLERVASARGARFVMGRVVTSHPYAQQFGCSHGLHPIGLLLGMIPARVRASGFAAPSQATSCVVYVRRFEERSHARRFALDAADAERVHAALSVLGIHSSGVPNRRRRPLGLGAIDESPELGVATLRFHEAAPPGELAAVLDERRDVRVLWADVPLEHPECAAVVSELREAGFTFASYLPLAGISGEDVVRLQRTSEPLDRDAIHACDEARAIVDSVFDEARGAEVAA